MSNETQDFELPNDIFQRAALAESMTKLICDASTEKLSPVALQGPWGCGKTVHAKRIKICIEEKFADTHKCIYWNAANSDYAEDPLPLFLASLYCEIDSSKQEPFSSLGLKLCCSTAWGITKKLSNQIIKKATGVNCEELVQTAEDTTRAAHESELLGDFRTFLDNASKDFKRIDTAKQLLSLVSENKELIIIIDELDRCRPLFALKMLEIIKHFFCHEKCKFILVMNNQSLIHSVQHIYGLSEDEANIYLNKYIKVHFHVPEITGDFYHAANCNYKYFIHLINEPTFARRGLTNDIIHNLCESGNLQLREIEKWIHTFNLVYSLAKNPELKDPESYLSIILIIISYMMAIKPEVLPQIQNRTIDADSILAMLSMNKNKYKTHSLLNFNNGFIRGMFIYLLNFSAQQAKAECEKCGMNERQIATLNAYSLTFKMWLYRATFLEIA